MLTDFEDEPAVTTMAEPSPGAQLLATLRSIPPLLKALLARNPVVQVTAPSVTVAPPAVQVAVAVPPRPCRTVVCTIERDRDGRATSITFTETDN